MNTLFSEFEAVVTLIYTSGQKSVGAEKGSCLTSTHWSSVKQQALFPFWSVATTNCFDWDASPRSGNLEYDVELELPRYAELQHTLDTQSSHTVEEKRKSAL